MAQSFKTLDLHRPYIRFCKQYMRMNKYFSRCKPVITVIDLTWVFRLDIFFFITDQPERKSIVIRKEIADILKSRCNAMTKDQGGVIHLTYFFLSIIG